MIITVKLFATLQKDRFIERPLELASETRVSEVLSMIGVSKEEAAIIFINGRHADMDSTLAEGDALSLFPPIGGG